MTANDISAVADLELGDYESLSDIQANMYMTDMMYNNYKMGSMSNYDYSQDSESIHSKFRITPKKTTMYSTITEKMESNPSTNGEFNFVINDKMDFLNYVDLFRRFPKIRVKDEMKNKFQISFTHNLGHNVINSFELLVDGDPKQTITNTWLDIHSQLFVPDNHRKNYRKNICDEKYGKLWSGGVVTEEKNKVWASELDSLTVKVPIPFSFEKTPFPIFLAKQSKVSIRGKFKTKYSELIKMRFKKDDNGPWEEIPFRWQVIHAISGEDHLIPDAPELYASYSKISEMERDSWLDQIKKEGMNGEKGLYKYYYNDIIINSYDKYHNSEEPFSDVLSSKTPTKGIFWVAQNVTGMKYNNYSNYTTNPYDIERGDHPVSKVSLKHGGHTHRFKDMDFSHFVDVMCYHHFPSSPYSKGYGGLAFSKNIFSVDADIGPILDKTKTSLSLILEGNINHDKLNDLKDSDLLASLVNEIENKNRPSNKYKIFVFVVVIKQLQFPIAGKIKVNDGS